ncbi:MAG: hypothetical protein ACRDRZ_12050 [Pseudonocardiaceae bacterium]
MKQRYVRLAAGLHPNDVVVRGGELDPVVLRADAVRNHSIYGCFGLSVFSGSSLYQVGLVPAWRVDGGKIVSFTA